MCLLLFLKQMPTGGWFKSFNCKRNDDHHSLYIAYMHYALYIYFITCFVFVSFAHNSVHHCLLFVAFVRSIMHHYYIVYNRACIFSFKMDLITSLSCKMLILNGSCVNLSASFFFLSFHSIMHSFIFGIQKWALMNITL